MIWPTASVHATPHRPLATKIGIVGCALLVLALAAIGTTLWITWQLQGGAAAVNEAGRMRMQTWRAAQALSSGQREQAAPMLDRLDASLRLLHRGDPARPLAVPRDAASAEALGRVDRQWRSLRAQWAQALAAPAPADAAATARQAEGFVADVDGLTATIEGQLARWTRVLNTAQLAMMALAVAAALSLLYTAQRLVFSPLSQLQDALALVGAGNLGARVPAEGNDEFAAVAEGFNAMAERLQGLYASLEQRVRDKTGHLEAERARLAVLYEGAALAAQAGTLEALAQGFVGQVRRAAHADAAALRWSDERNQRYVLLAADRLPAELAEAEHCMPTGICLCGQPRASAAIRMFTLEELQAGPVPPAMLEPGLCRRAGFASVLSVPVRLKDRLLGEIDIFYRQPATLADGDRSLLETLASHLAGAIEALRVDALRREAAVSEERSLIARELHDSIAQGLAFLKIQSGLLRDEVAGMPAGETERLRHTLAELDTGIRESLADVRELLLHFRTRADAEDILPALRTTLTKFEHQTGLPAHLDVEGEGMALPADVQIQVLHVVQEALSNVRKHACASQVWIDVRQSPQWIIEVRDDGTGLDAAALTPDETHVGLRIMRERAAGIGAQLDIHSVPGAGTSVVLILPPTLSAALSPATPVPVATRS